MRLRPKKRFAPWIVLIAPFVGLLVPALYARQTPEWNGVPFFYWYQFAWLFATSLLVAFVYRQTR